MQPERAKRWPRRRIALLPDRGVVSVTGADAAKLLQGVITNDMDLLATPAARSMPALLTPQGKILFEFFVVPSPDGFCLETARAKAAELAKRLTMYRLRAKVDIKDASRRLYAWPPSGAAASTPHAATARRPSGLPIRGLPALGHRELATLRSDWALGAEDADSATPEDYHAHRIALGVPEGGKDYAFGDAFPHEAGFDQLNGVSFTKGCYVGQEVVSRMQNRGTVRRARRAGRCGGGIAGDAARQSRQAASRSARSARSRGARAGAAAARPRRRGHRQGRAAARPAASRCASSMPDVGALLAQAPGHGRMTP